jgi:hypothetical protein
VAQVGLVTLGPSVTQPNLVDWLDNQDGAAWLTFDNRLSVSVGAVPAYSEGSPDQQPLLQLPALTRSTIPIDPAKGVQLQVLAHNRFQGPQSAPLALDLFAVKRSCPYMLHNAGGAPSCPLYPTEALVPATTNVAASGSGSADFWVGTSAPPAFLTALQLAAGPADTCIVAATVVLQQPVTYTTSVSLMAATLWMDLDDASPSLGGYTLFVPGEAGGASATFDCCGAQALRISSGGAAADFAAYALTAWLGVPPS